MASYYSIHIPIFVIFALFIQIAISENPLYSICSNSQNFTSNSPHEKNLIQLLGQLTFKTHPTGFGQGSSGQYPDEVYGLSLCRGDISVKDCLTCVVEANAEIVKRCPKDKGAIVWYDNCYVKYSNDDFLGKVDAQNKFYLLNVQNVSTNPEGFNMKVKGLMSDLSVKACQTSKLYAGGQAEVDAYEKIYGMVQCSRDLSKADCKKCLDNAIGDLPSCCQGKIGGRVIGGSCSIRYEISPFLIDS